MMFTSIIGTLTSLLPKTFIFGSYMPVLIFSFINLALVYVFSAWSRSGIEFWFGKNPTLSIAVAFVTTVVLAYVLAAVNDSMREFLEGKYLPAFLEQPLCDEQRALRIKLADRYASARSQRYSLAEDVELWQEHLRDASAGTYTPPPRRTAFTGNPMETTRTMVAAGALGKILHGPLPPEKFDELRAHVELAVEQLVELFVNARSIANADEKRRRQRKLEGKRSDLLVRIGAILNSMSELEYQTGADLFMRFGNDPVRPTGMGNIAAAIHAYSIGRYKMELTVFISRLQTVLVRNGDKGYPIVLDAKAQLDFLIACCWFSGFTTVFWTVSLAISGGNLWTYFITAFGGLLVTSAFYLGASQNYLSYAEVVRASVDVNRFTLLRELDVRLPRSLREERMLWATMNQLAFSGGDSTEFSYEHAKK